jgi:hypothetical protein
MDKVEARALADAVLDELRQESYDSLVARLLDEVETRETVGRSGVKYQLEVQAVWDNGKRGNLRVMVAVDDGGWRALAPQCSDFIVAPDGSFIGEG